MKENDRLQQRFGEGFIGPEGCIYIDDNQIGVVYSEPKHLRLFPPGYIPTFIQTISGYVPPIIFFPKFKHFSRPNCPDHNKGQSKLEPKRVSSQNRINQNR